jgi:hypothetical protein
MDCSRSRGSTAARSRGCYVKADEEEQSGPKDVSREQKSNRGENACHGDDDADNNDHLRTVTNRGRPARPLSEFEHTPFAWAEDRLRCMIAGRWIRQDIGPGWAGRVAVLCDDPRDQHSGDLHGIPAEHQTPNDRCHPAEAEQQRDPSAYSPPPICIGGAFCSLRTLVSLSDRMTEAGAVLVNAQYIGPPLARSMAKLPG